MHESIKQLKVKLFLDSAHHVDVLELHNKPYIKGLTTNPTLMRQAGVQDYQTFAKQMLALVPDKPISFTVCSDDLNEMEQQALQISSWGEHVLVKIPVTTTKGKPCYGLIERLAAQQIKLNITAVMTITQVRQILEVLCPDIPSYISIFAGRIADTGRDPVHIMREAVELVKDYLQLELIWASSRELLNIFQANEVGCHIITVTKDILKKLSLIGYSLEEYSLDTVKMFHNDMLRAGFIL